MNKICLVIIASALIVPLVGAQKKATAPQGLWEKITAFFEPTADEHFTEEHEFDPKGTVTIKAHTGSVVIHTWDKSAVALEITRSGKEAERLNTSYAVSHSKEAITIQTETAKNGDETAHIAYVLTVPQHATVIVQQKSGPISIFDLFGAIVAEADDGDITIENARSSVTARSNKQSITLAQSKLPETATIFLQAYRDITLTLPELINANLDAQTAGGVVSSEIPVTLEPITLKINNATWKNMRKHIQGALGSGGAPITLDATRGSIMIEAWS